MIATVGDKSDVCKSGVTSEHTTRDKNISHSYQENQAYYIHTYWLVRTARDYYKLSNVLYAHLFIKQAKEQMARIVLTLKMK